MADTSGKTIDEVTPDTSVSGSEKIPVSDSGEAKSLTTAKLKDYVIEAISAITASESVTIAQDGVFIERDGALKPVSASVLAEAIYATMFAKTPIIPYDSQTHVGGLDTEDKIVVKHDGETRTATVNDIMLYVERYADLGLDIDGIPDLENPLDGDMKMVVGERPTGTTVWGALRTTLAAIKNFILGKIPGDTPTSTATVGSDDYLVIATGSPLALKKVKRSDAGLASGDVTGPSNAVENYLPQWSASNEKTLKAGVEVLKPRDVPPSSTISSSSTDSQIPTARNVYLAMQGIGGKVSAPGSTIAANEVWIPIWDYSTTESRQCDMILKGFSFNGSSLITEGIWSQSVIPSCAVVYIQCLAATNSAREKVIEVSEIPRGFPSVASYLDYLHDIDFRIRFVAIPSVPDKLYYFVDETVGWRSIDSSAVS